MIFNPVSCRSWRTRRSSFAIKSSFSRTSADYVEVKLTMRGFGQKVSKSYSRCHDAKVRQSPTLSPTEALPQRSSPTTSTVGRGSYVGDPSQRHSSDSTQNVPMRHSSCLEEEPSHDSRCHRGPTVCHHPQLILPNAPKTASCCELYKQSTLLLFCMR